MRIDLHTHTSASDGSLDPMRLCRRAANRGVDYLSITDHDTCAAYLELETAESMPLQLIPGIEFSSYWENTGIHILGLNINLQSDILHEAIASQQKARRLRAEQISVRLEKYGIENALPEVERIAENSYIGRPHFAQHLVNVGKVRNIKEAFRKFLGAGKPGDVKKNWAPMPKIIDWIRGAGGTAILAHPAKYGLTWTKLSTLIDAFSASGGQGIEVISGPQQLQLTERLGKLSVQKKMLASCGSDFHQPENTWSDLGRIVKLPDHCMPVWKEWNLE